MVSAGSGRLGILAGGGGLPAAVAEEVIGSGGEVHIIGIRGEADASIERFAHSWMHWVEVGRLLDILRTEGCRRLIIIGSVSRPDLAKLKLDLGTVLNLPLLVGLLIGGDDSVLSNVVRFFELKGLEVLGAHQVAPSLVAPVGPIGRQRPGSSDRKDVAKGLEVVKALGRLDVGQACVVARGYVLAVEAAEGTDAMLGRAAGLRQWGQKPGSKRNGVLVKRPKPNQELRVDMPAIGPRTVELAAAAGLAGIAVMAGSVLLVDRAELVRAADAAQIFVSGVEDAL